MVDTSTFNLRTSTYADSVKKLQRLDYVVILLLLTTALGMRLFLYRFHDVISVDGTGYVGAARRLLDGDVSGLSFYGLYPVLAWLTGLAGPDLETAAHLVSVVMGGLLVVPLYLLGVDMFSRATAFAACIVTIVWSSHLFASCQVATQATYTTLALTGIYLVRRMFESRAPSHGCWAGLIVGLAFLTRPEAFLLFFVMPIAPLLEKRREFNLLWRTVVAYCAVFAFILCMNMILVHHYTGTWQLAAKTSSALNDTVSFYLKLSDLNQIPGVQSIGYLEFITKYPDLFLTNPINNLKKMFATVLPAFFWIFTLIGFLSGGWRKERLFDRLFLICSFAPLGVIIVFYYISPGYVEPFLPVFFLWCAEGGRAVERFLSGLLPAGSRQGFERFARHTPAVMAASAIYAVFLFVPQIPVQRNLTIYTWRDDDGRFDHKRLGFILRQYLPPGKIMTRWPRLAYYSGHELVGIPNTDFDGIMKASIDSGARFLVLDGRIPGPRPQLDFLLEPLDRVAGLSLSTSPVTTGRKPGLYLYLAYTYPGSLGVIVYEIVR
jgi:Dolichyl-phosphate-mannose-protein mannosyltransferase